MKVHLAQQTAQMQQDLLTCADCHHIGSTDQVVPCGWHENLVAATRAVAAVVDATDGVNLEVDD